MQPTDGNIGLIYVGCQCMSSDQFGLLGALVSWEVFWLVFGLADHFSYFRLKGKHMDSEIEEYPHRILKQQ